MWSGAKPVAPEGSVGGPDSAKSLYTLTNNTHDPWGAVSREAVPWGRNHTTGE